MHSVHAHGAGKVRVAAPPRCLKSVYQRFSSFSLRMAIVNSELTWHLVVTLRSDWCVWRVRISADVRLWLCIEENRPTASC